MNQGVNEPRSLLSTAEFNFHPPTHRSCLWGSSPAFAHVVSCLWTPSLAAPGPQLPNGTPVLPKSSHSLSENETGTQGSCCCLPFPLPAPCNCHKVLGVSRQKYLFLIMDLVSSADLLEPRPVPPFRLLVIFLKQRLKILKKQGASFLYLQVI